MNRRLSIPPSKHGVRENAGCMILSILLLGAVLFVAVSISR